MNKTLSLILALSLIAVVLISVIEAGPRQHKEFKKGVPMFLKSRSEAGQLEGVEKAKSRAHIHKYIDATVSNHSGNNSPEVASPEHVKSKRSAKLSAKERKQKKIDLKLKKKAKLEKKQ